mmetsp:Transcript_11022/g.30435  ORF Transcript_11022/g.30435 Transcript_11022/m.30435 type:complete len:235 (-) Transcript_11022:295-999(-)
MMRQSFFIRYSSSAWISAMASGSRYSTITVGSGSFSHSTPPPLSSSPLPPASSVLAFSSSSLASSFLTVAACFTRASNTVRRSACTSCILGAVRWAASCGDGLSASPGSTSVDADVATAAADLIALYSAGKFSIILFPFSTRSSSSSTPTQWRHCLRTRASKHTRPSPAPKSYITSSSVTLPNSRMEWISGIELPHGGASESPSIHIPARNGSFSSSSSSSKYRSLRSCCCCCC